MSRPLYPPASHPLPEDSEEGVFPAVVLEVEYPNFALMNVMAWLFSLGVAQKLNCSEGLAFAVFRT